jgi:hypothetical protein
MQTKTTIQTRIAELEQCLDDFPLHPNKTAMDTEITSLYNLLENEAYEIDNRTIERDTFDIRDLNFYEV